MNNIINAKIAYSDLYLLFGGKKVVCIRFYDFQNVGQYHELQRRRICNWKAF